MDQPNAKEGTVFQTPWFEIVSRPVRGLDQPYYAIRAPDFAIIVGLNSQGRLLLVRQYRPAVGRFTLELPAGYIEPGETPEAAARKELGEETGHEADRLELLATLSPSTARFTSCMWIYFAPNVRPAAQPAYPREAGVKVVFHGGGIRSLLNKKDFIAASSCAALFAAAARGKLTI